jgi:predicted MFS family arabinose efflux permease
MIKVELQLSDTELGLLSGIAFTTCYAALGLPLAIWADRGTRRDIIALALALFSAMTVFSGLAASFLQLVAIRAFLAVGESGTTPSSHSMISDMFPREYRGSALGAYSFGINFGIFAGFLAGGWVSQLYGWRDAFFVAGAPGLLVAMLVRFTLKEPKRGSADALAATVTAPAPPRIAAVLRMLWSQRAFRHLMSGVVIVAMGNISLTQWLPAFLSRTYSMAPRTIGTLLALMLGIGGGAGTLISGMLADRLGRRDIRWNLWIVAAITAITFPFYAGTFLANRENATLAFLVYPACALSAYLAPSVSMTQILVTPQMRAQASAVFALLMSLIGGLGPSFTGALSDALRPRFAAGSLKVAMLSMAVVYLWAAVHFVLAARTLKTDTERAYDMSQHPV